MSSGTGSEVSKVRIRGIRGRSSELVVFLGDLVSGWAYHLPKAPDHNSSILLHLLHRRPGHLRRFLARPLILDDTLGVVPAIKLADGLERRDGLRFRAVADDVVGLGAEVVLEHADGVSVRDGAQHIVKLKRDRVAAADECDRGAGA